MKKYLKRLFNVLTLLLTFGLAGCMTGPNGKPAPDIERISLGIRGTVKIGTKAELLRNPQSRTAFSAALVSLERLQASGAITPNSLLDSLRLLPIKHFAGPDGELTFDGIGLLLSLTNWSKVDVERQAQLKPIVQAFIDGLIDAGITP